MRSALISRSAAAFALAFATGCANVEIDVDVYKGALANHQDMQVQQIGAMAIAARPLLVSLRDELAMADIQRKLDTAFGDPRRNEWRKDARDYFEKTCPWKDNSWVREFERRECDSLVDDRAERVNAIVNLYEPRGLEFEGLAKLTLAARNSIIDIAQRESTRRKWNEAHAKEWREAYSSPNDRLKTAFERFIGIRDANLPDAVGRSRAAALVAALYNDPNQSLEHISVNAAQRLLEADPGWHATLKALFAPKAKLGAPNSSTETPAGDRAVEEVRAAAVNIRMAREAFERGYRLLLDLYEDPSTLVKAQELVGRSVTNSEARRSIARLIGLMTDGESAALVASSSFGPPVSGLADSTMPPATSFLGCDSGNRLANSGAYPQLAAAAAARVGVWLEAAAEKDTASAVSAVKALREAHVALTGGTRSRSTLSILCNKSAPIVVFPDTERFAYGMARAPSFSVDTVRFETAWAGALGDSGLGIDEGADTKGIVERIQEFVRQNEKAQSVPPKDGALRPAAWPLLDAVGDFAAKVAFLANNDSIFTGYDGGTRASVTRYIAALQAVANQLTVQIDELRRRQTYLARSPGGTAMKAAAEKLALDPGRIVDDLIAAVAAMPPSDTATLRDAKKKLSDAKLSEDPAVAGRAVDAARQDKLTKDNALAPIKSQADNLSLISTEIKSGRLKKALDEMATALPAPPPSTAFSDFRVDLESKIAPLPPRTFATDLDETKLAAKLKEYLDQVSQIPPFSIAAAKQTFAAWRQNFERRLDLDKTNGDGALKTAQAAADAAKKKLEEATEAKQFAELIDKLEKDTAARNAAGAILLAKRADLIAAYSGAQPSISADAAWKAVLDRIAALQSAALNADKPAWTTASAVAKTFNPPLSRDVAGALATLPDGATAVDTFDALIRNLRFEYVEVSRRLGAESPQARQIANAISIAIDQRSEMAYIVPPSAFLRMVNAASAIQPNPGLGAENRLQRSFWRSIPLIGASIANLEEMDNLRVRADIDRQNWQNINRVRLDGVGRTNFVLVKDDIGNWYAKGYESDPAKLSESMRKLAMFNLGARMPGLSPAAVGPGSGGQTANTTRTDQTQMERAFTKFRDDHAEKIKALYATVRKLSGIDKPDAQGSILGTARDKIAAMDAVDADKRDSVNKLLANYWTDTKMLAEPPKLDAKQDETAERRRLIAERLRDMVAFRKLAVAAAADAAKKDDPGATDKNADKARAGMSSALTKSIADAYAELLAAIDDLERSTLVLNAATKD